MSTALTCGASECPVVLLDGATHADTFAVRLRVTGKLPVRRVQLGLSGRGGSASRVTCEEPNVLFYPGGSYSIVCQYPQTPSARTAVRLKSVMLSDGTVWEKIPRLSCGSVDIARKPRHR